MLLSIRAKLRAAVFEAIEEEDGSSKGTAKYQPNEILESNLSKTSLAVVMEFFRKFNFNNTACVLAAECGIAKDNSSLSMESVSKFVGYDVTSNKDCSALELMLANVSSTADTNTNTTTSISGTNEKSNCSSNSNSNSNENQPKSEAEAEVPPSPPPVIGTKAPAPSQTFNNSINNSSNSNSNNCNSNSTSSTKRNRNIRLDISDDSVDLEASTPLSVATPTKKDASPLSSTGGSDSFASPSPQKQIRTKSPTEPTSGKKNSLLSSLSPSSLFGKTSPSSSSSSKKGKTKLHKLGGISPKASLSPITKNDPFGKPKLPSSPIPSPCESLESSLELTSNSMSMSFNAQQLAAVAGSGGGVEKAKDAAISESTSLDNNVKMEELNDKLGKVAEEEKQGKAVKEAEAEVEVEARAEGEEAAKVEVEVQVVKEAEAQSPSSKTNVSEKTEESYDDDYEEDYESGGSFDDEVDEILP